MRSPAALYLISSLARNPPPVEIPAILFIGLVDCEDDV